MMKALTTLVVGVGKATALAGLQYLSMILEALQTSSDAVVPQLDVTALVMRWLTDCSSLVLEQMHDCRSVAPSPHFELYVSDAMLYEMADLAHGACESRRSASVSCRDGSFLIAS